MGRDKWLEKRKRGIGGSDAPVVCGLSPWKTPYQLWAFKRSEPGYQEDEPETEPMRWGTLLEPVVRQRYADVTGRIVTVPGEILVHPKREWQIGTVDGIAGDRILECKTAKSDIGWGEPFTDEVPEHYMVQVQHYLMVSGLSIADIAVLFHGSDFRIYEVHANPDLQAAITDREEQFWRMVQENTPPPATSFADLLQKFGRISRAVTIQATDPVLAAIARLKALKSIEKEAEELKAVIMAHLGEADTLVDGDKVLATWKLTKPGKRFDLDAFRAENPDLAAQYDKTTNPSRRLLVK